MRSQFLRGTVYLWRAWRTRDCRKCVVFGELVGTEKRVDRRIAQDDGTRDGTFHGEMDRCRESQGWNTACSSMPERDGKDQGEDSPNQEDCADSLATVDEPQVARTCLPRFFFSCLTSNFIFCFRFLFTPSPRPNRSSLCMRVKSHTQVANNCLLCFYLFCSSEMMMSLLTSIMYGTIVVSFFVWGLRCTSSFRMVLLYLVTTGWILISAHVRFHSIKINK